MRRINCLDSIIIDKLKKLKEILQLFTVRSADREKRKKRQQRRVLTGEIIDPLIGSRKGQTNVKVTLVSGESR